MSLCDVGLWSVTKIVLTLLVIIDKSLGIYSISHSWIVDNGFRVHLQYTFTYIHWFREPKAKFQCQTLIKNSERLVIVVWWYIADHSTKIRTLTILAYTQLASSWQFNLYSLKPVPNVDTFTIYRSITYRSFTAKTEKNFCVICFWTVMVEYRVTASTGNYNTTSDM